MVRALTFLLAALAALLPGGVLAQSGARAVTTTSWVEEWDPVRGEWVRIDEGPSGHIAATRSGVTTTVNRAGLVTITEAINSVPRAGVSFTSASVVAEQAQFGPFRVLDARRAALVGSTDAASPGDFAAMVSAFPGLRVIEFTDAPGTSHDIANLALGRAIRAAGLATHVPAGGSARSGAVELFLAGTRRTIDPGARFAVHAWRDGAGREPADFAPEAPENRLYLDYYAEMGMSASQARAFYAMTNSVPHSDALWLEGEQMARWITPDAPAAKELPREVDAKLRQVLARSGAALAEVMSLCLPSLAARPMREPRIVSADPGAALLDSATAFP